MYILSYKKYMSLNRNRSTTGQNNAKFRFVYSSERLHLLKTDLPESLIVTVLIRSDLHKYSGALPRYTTTSLIIKLPC